MRIQHNIAALNSYRQLNTNNNNVAKNLEKLSSGYRINKAGDDAAGLSISEKMRSQITGLETAKKNSEDGISLIQTAEGNLQEVHSMLNRMVELATQSSNGTYSDFNREQLQKEINSLNSEVDRIAESANFNGLKLLDGSLSSKGATAGASTVKLDGNLTAITLADPTKWDMTSASTTIINETSAKALAQGSKVEMVFTYEENGSTKNASISLTLGKDSNGKDIFIGGSGQEYSITTDAVGGAVTTDLEKALSTEVRKSGLEDKFTFTATWGADGTIQAEAKEAGLGGAKLINVSEAIYDKDGAAVVAPTNVTMTQNTAGADAHYTAVAPAVQYTGANEKDAVFTVNGKKYMLALDNQDVSGVSKDINVIFGTDADTAGANAASQITKDTGLNVTYDAATDTFSFKAGSGTAGKGGLTLQVGDSNEAYQKVTVSVGKMDAKSLGISGINISNQGGAQSAIDSINAAIDSVSATRGDLGALQNRLDHTINNIGVAVENMTAAESRIRDTDMASEMMDFTKNNILTQAAQAMMAQANMIPQGVLQLLQ